MMVILSFVLTIMVFIGLIILIIVGILIYCNKYFIYKTFANNWREAKHIVNERILK